MSREEIDAAIARHAKQETLFDQPYEDPGRVRISGPFTVEAISPHRVVSSEVEASLESRRRSFEASILENLKKAGVQNTVREERLVFESLEPYAGAWLQAAGEYRENGVTRRAAACIGPEYGTVGADMVREAAKEAMKGAGFDLLIVCGFAFDAHASEAAAFMAKGQRQYGKLPVLLARINPELSMGDGLLKKTGAANLFMVFGEPDVEIQRQADDQLTVEIRGVDVYDPTTGQIRSHSTSDVACWFIDTCYNDETFFVRHAYFTGANDPYERLRRALRAEIDETA